MIQVRTTLPVSHLPFHLSSLSSSHRLGTRAAVVAAAAAAAEAAARSRNLFDAVCLKQAIATSLWDVARATGRRKTLRSEFRVWANMVFCSLAEGAATPLHQSRPDFARRASLGKPECLKCGLTCWPERATKRPLDLWSCAQLRSSTRRPEARGSWRHGIWPRESLMQVLLAVAKTCNKRSSTQVQL